MTVWLLEDEAEFAELFQTKLRQYCEAVSSFVWLQRLDDALAQAARETPDVLIADIQLKGESGIDAARVLLDRFSALKVIFLTGSPEASQDIFSSVQPYAVRFKNHGALKYIVDDLQKIAAELDSGAHRLRMMPYGKAVDLPLRDVSHIEHMRNDSILHLPNEKELRLRLKLDDIMPLLDSRFVRCGRSDIVNLDYVTGMEEDCFMMLDSLMIPISRGYKLAAIEGFHVHKGGVA